jgi:cytidine deaminase
MKNIDLRNKAQEASTHAYSPYSKACVGSAILTEDNIIYSGCNVENSSYGGTVCAERVAIFKAVSDKPIRLKKVYVYSKDGWPPCGMCRQVISEFAASDLEIIIGNEKGHETVIKFSDLMPLAFTPDKLLN